MSKARIVVDISSLADVAFVSGIQRVVREIMTRMLKRRTDPDIEFLLVAYSLKRLQFYRVPTQQFLNCYQDGLIKASALSDGEIISLEELGPGDIFFDIDSVWNNRMRRSFLLPLLKKQGVSIAVHIYDIIPVLYPQYCDDQTALRFMDYLGAHMLYADLVIANTRSTLRDVNALAGQIGTKPLPGVCAPLGANFVKAGSADLNPAEKVDTRALSLDKACYILMVGTIEPRKNHDFILDIYQQKLHAEGIRLVIAGRPGWNVDALMTRILGLQQSDPDFIYLDKANDATINYLYAHAFFTVFPTKYEGFGLPVIESFLHRTPVLASDIPVLREVGGDFCEYFSLDDITDLPELLLQYKKNPEAYSFHKQRLEAYVPFSWDQSEEVMWEALLSLVRNSGEVCK